MNNLVGGIRWSAGGHGNTLTGRPELNHRRPRIAWEQGLARAGFVGHNSRMKKEFVFQIEQDENMLVATCREPEMATQEENLDGLLAMIRDLIRCRFDEGDERRAWPIRLHFLHDPVLSAQVA
jgi:hypothetical protein